MRPSWNHLQSNPQRRAIGWISQHVNALRINVLIGRQLLVEEERFGLSCVRLSDVWLNLLPIPLKVEVVGLEPTYSKRPVLQTGGSTILPSLPCKCGINTILLLYHTFLILSRGNLFSFYFFFSLTDIIIRKFINSFYILF
jgi:hypothetical protein